MWVATNEGLNRFDGHRFEHFTKQNYGLNSNRINNMEVDSIGDIWISYLQDEFKALETQILRPKSRELISIKEKLGRNYKEEYKVLRLSNVKALPEIHLQSKVNKFVYSPQKGMRKVDYRPIFYNPTNSNYWTSKSKASKTLYEHTPQGEIINTLNINDTRLGGRVMPSGNHFILVDNDKMKRTLYLKRHKTSDLEEVISSKDIKLMECGAWSDFTLYIDFKGKILTYDLRELMTKAPAYAIFDQQNNIWIHNAEGIFIISIKEQMFNQYLVNEGLNNKSYDGRGIWADSTYLYSFSPKGAFRWHFQQQEKEPLLKEVNTHQNSLSVTNGKDDYLWVGGKRRPLIKIDKTTGKAIETIKDIKHQVWSIHEDKNKRVWIGQGKNGLLYYDIKGMETVAQYTQLNGFDELEEGKIIHIVEDKRDNNYLWLSCESGWYRLNIKDGIKARFWNGSDSRFNIPSDNVYYTYQDDKGVFWLATAHSGLLKVELTKDFEVQSIEEFTTNDGLTSNTIYAIFEDKNGFLWMSSKNGIIRFNKKTKDVRAFLEADGLSHYEFNRTSSFQREDGTIFFGSLNGIVSFYPKNLNSKDIYEIPLKISRCEKYSDKEEKIINVTTDVLAKNKITVAPSERLVTLYVSLQDYIDATSLKYAYRIKGLQEEFTFSNSNEITLSGLPYGKYQLEIKGKGKDGRFSTQMISIPLIILRPFYLQWWFILLAIATIVLFFWQLFQARTKTLLNRKKELEEIVKDRTSQLQKQANQLEQDKNIIKEQADELRSLDEMKSRFFTNISHELRTPLTLILSPIQSILKRRKVDNRDFTSAQIVEQNAQKLLKRINEILDLTRLEAREMELKPQPTPFYTFVKRLIATFESLATQKDQQITFQFQLDKSLQLMLDQDKYEHIFNNYLSNAIKYTPNKGQINIRLYEKQIESQNDTLENQIILSVSDNGQGILKEDLPKVFDRFFQTKTNRNTTGSSGIGLALSKEIAILLNGQVRVESEIGQGSIFYFEMPYIESVGSLELLTPSSQFSESPIVLTPVEYVENKPNLLLVEDNPQLRNYIQLILQEKYNITTAENGRVALDKLKTHSDSYRDKISLIVSDIMMPIMDGFELLEHLKQSDALRHIPVIMLTARSNIKDKLEALRIGVDDYMLKPFQEEELLARISNLIKNAEQKTVVIEGSSQKKQKVIPQVSASDLKWLKQIEQRLKADISNSKINVESLTAELNISRSQIQRRIKKITGLTPVYYFREIKLNAARELLENGEVQTVNEVAYAVGFDTPKYFSTLYEERFGKRPSAYL